MKQLHLGVWNRGATRKQHSTRYHYFPIRLGHIEASSLCGMGYDPRREDIQGKVPHYACDRCLSILRKTNVNPKVN